MVVDTLRTLSEIVAFYRSRLFLVDSWIDFRIYGLHHLRFEEVLLLDSLLRLLDSLQSLSLLHSFKISSRATLFVSSSK